METLRWKKKVGKAGDNKHIPPGYEYLYVWTSVSSSVFRSHRPEGGKTNHFQILFIYRIKTIDKV